MSRGPIRGPSHRDTGIKVKLDIRIMVISRIIIMFQIRIKSTICPVKNSGKQKCAKALLKETVLKNSVVMLIRKMS